jgi:long-chain acyl-CoA synthetase
MTEVTVPAEREIPPDRTLADLLLTAHRERPESVQLRRRVDGTWTDVTVAAFTAQVDALAKGLIAAGIEPGDRVAIMSRTRYEWSLLDFAILMAGAVTVPIYETSSAEQVSWILTDSGARGVAVESEDNRGMVASLAPRLPDLRHIWHIEGEDLSRLADGAGNVDNEQLSARHTGRTSTDLATIVYTSGTTGNPKGCALTHGNLLAAAEGALAGALAKDFRAGTSTLLFIPLAHIFGRDVQFGCLMQGVTLGHTNDIPNLVADLAAFQPDFLLSVPRVFEKVYNMAAARAAAEGKGRLFDLAVRTAVDYDKARRKGTVWPPLRLRHAVFDVLVYSKLRGRLGGNVTWAVSAGAPLGTRLGHFFGGVGISIYEGYGMTENGGPGTLNHPDAMKVGSVGRPIPGCTIRIAEDGEVLMKGPHVFSGYWNNPDATHAAIDPDGWLHTGDVGSLDEKGFLTITGRKKDLIVTAGGKNVAPAVLEDRMRAHRLVSQVVVVGDARPFVAALVTLDREFLPTWLELKGRDPGTPAEKLCEDPEVITEIQGAVDEANKAVSKAESVRRFTVLADDLTIEGGHLTPSLKVRRSAVLAEFDDSIEGLYQ